MSVFTTLKFILRSKDTRHIPFTLFDFSVKYPGVYWLEDPGQLLLLPELQSLLLQQPILDVAQRYFGAPPIISTVNVCAIIANRDTPLDEWHANSRPSTSITIYVVLVSNFSAQGPISTQQGIVERIIIPGSHNFLPFQKVKDNTMSWDNIISDETVRQHFESSGWIRLPMIQGTVYVEDTHVLNKVYIFKEPLFFSAPY